MDEKQQKEIKEIVEKFLSTLSVDAAVSISPNEEGVDVLLETEESGIVIGRRGESLEALQLLLSLAVSKKIGNFVRVSLEVGDYRKNRNEMLVRMAEEAKEQALSEQREISLPELKSWERRVIHMLLQNDPEVTSESIGEGKERVLLVKPR